MNKKDEFLERLYHRVRIELPDKKLWNSRFSGTLNKGE